MIDIYPCQSGGSKPCNIKMSPNDMLISTFLYEKTPNIKDYEDPISNINREVGRIIPSTGLRYARELKVGQTDIVTDKGFFTPNMVIEKMPTLFDSNNEINDKSLKNIPRNYTSQGLLFYTDLEIHMEIMTSNEKVEIYRSYFSIIDSLSALGG
jgi:hypothetical protein